MYPKLRSKHGYEDPVEFVDLDSLNTCSSFVTCITHFPLGSLWNGRTSTGLAMRAGVFG